MVDYEGSGSSAPQAEVARSIGSQIARFTFITSKAERVHTDRLGLARRERELEELFESDGSEIAAPAGHVFSVSYKKEIDGHIEARLISHLRWDAKRQIGLDTVAEKSEFMAGKIVLNRETGQAWAVSPDEQVCINYYEGAEVEVRALDSSPLELGS